MEIKPFSFFKDFLERKEEEGEQEEKERMDGKEEDWIIESRDENIGFV